MPDVEAWFEVLPDGSEIGLSVGVSISGLIGTEVFQTATSLLEFLDDHLHSLAMCHLGLALGAGPSLSFHLGLANCFVVHRVHQVNKTILIQERACAIRSCTKLPLAPGALFIHS